jgi:hypothetical protein
MLAGLVGSTILLLRHPKEGIQVRRSLFYVGLLAVAFVFLLIWLALRPYMGTIGLVLFVIFLLIAGIVAILALVGLVTGLFALFSRAAQGYYHLQSKRLDLALKHTALEQAKINQNYIITQEGQKAYGFFREVGDEREFVPLADPQRVINNYRGAIVSEELPPQALLEGPRLPEAEPFRDIWPRLSARYVILGYRLDQGASRAIPATLALLLSSIIVGRPGTGKTSLMRFLLAVILKAGGFAVLWDSHNSVLKHTAHHQAVYEGFRDEQRLTRRGDECPEHLVFLARTYPEMKATLAAVEALLEQRKALGEDHPFPPFFWLADEWLQNYEHVPEATRVLLRVVTEGRKYRMYAAVAGHNFSAESIGGTKVKDNASTQFAFRTNVRQATLIGFEAATYRQQFLNIVDEEFGDVPDAGLTEEHDPSAGWCLIKATVLKPTLIKISQVEADDMVLVFDEVMRERVHVGPQDLPSEEEDEDAADYEEQGQVVAGQAGGRNYLQNRGTPQVPLAVQTLASQAWAKERAQHKLPLPEQLRVCELCPSVDQLVIQEIWFWYVTKRRARRDLIELMGGRGNGGRFFSNVIKPVCDAIDQVRDQDELVSVPLQTAEDAAG